MLIAEFAEVTGLTRDAVRFYVKHGLLRPRVFATGNRYQHFEEADLERVVMIQTAQSLGFTIRQIVGFNEELESGKMDRARQITVMSERLAALELQAAKLNAMRGYLRKKISWMKGGQLGPAPQLKGRPTVDALIAVDQVDCLHDTQHNQSHADKQADKQAAKQTAISRGRAGARPRTAARG